MARQSSAPSTRATGCGQATSSRSRRSSRSTARPQWCSRASRRPWIASGTCCSRAHRDNRLRCRATAERVKERDMQLQPGVLAISGFLSLALIVLPLGLPVWARVLLIVTMPAWLGPIVIRFRQTQPRSAEFAPIGSTAPDAVRASFDTTRETLAAQGFVEVGRLEQTNSNKGMAGFVQLLDHPTTYAVCSRLAIADPASGNLRADLVVLLTDRTAGLTLVTSNATIIAPFPTNPQFDTVWFPDVRDPV